MGKVELFFNKNLPSRVDEIYDPLFDDKQLKVYVKRDDLLHPHISGNKWRKLKYLLMQAEVESKKHIVSFGGAYSNHLPALAAACHELGFDSTGIIRGEELNDESNAQLSFCKKKGMNLIFVGREKYKNKKQIFDEFLAWTPTSDNHFGQSSTTLFVDEGGYSILGAKGCEAIIDELECEYDHIILPVGTGTTLAGMENAINLSKTKLHGIVVLKGAEYLAEQIKILAPESTNWQLHHQFHAGGFAKATKELLKFIQTKQMVWNIPFEPVYSGKMAFGFYRLASEGLFEEGTKVLMVHTGGL
ncbi:MAG: pyridoxal-phosphate dependent enzyme [Flavobacteriaceae bacterium]|nr:pyridoxal-phosphate dependent enzyme [Flavobacteriaceae bacterium]